MSSCKDCLHVEVCPFKRYRVEKDRMEKRCSFFKDRSRFVVFPCKIGDELYTIVRGYKIRKWIVTDLSVSAYSSLNETVITAREKNGSKHLRFSERFLGKTVFLTIEEAEQALKEREENA